MKRSRKHPVKLYGFLLLMFVLVLSMSIFFVSQAQFRAFHRQLTQILSIAALPSTPSPTPRTQNTPTTVQSNPGCGVTKNSDGSYHYSWLHVSGGKIVDENNCPVTLVGLNTAGLEFGDGSGGDMTQAHIQQLHQTFNMNLWRVAINVSWWNNNAFVPAVHLHYQDWIKQQIQWMKDYGNYVEIDPTNYVTIPPNSGVQFCSNESSNPPPDPNCIPSQDTSNNPPWTEHQMVDATVKFWDSIVPLYNNDPAIVYDALNEPYPSNDPAHSYFENPVNDLNTMINVIQKDNSKALVFVYAHQTDQIAKGQIPDYTQPNLVWDFHIYHDPAWPWNQKLQDFQNIFTYAQQHNHAVTIGEWGDSQLASNKALADFADAILNLVKTRGFATSYYNANNMMDNGQLSDQGTIVQQEYASLAKFP